VTTREQTAIDVLNRVSLSCGSENALRSISSFTYIDAGKMAELASATNLSTCARVGWLLENKRAEWGVSEQTLDSLNGAIGSGPHYFYSSTQPKDSYWSNKWKLYLPLPEKVMVSWLTA
jgi:hypothetical protein